MTTTTPASDQPPMTNRCLLSVAQLSVGFQQGNTWTEAVKEATFHIDRGECFALVGESGSGKSISALSILRLLPQGGRILKGSARLDGVDLFKLKEQAMESVRGRRVGIVFQDPMISMNPVLTVGRQIEEGLAQRHTLSRSQRRRRVLELMDQVGLPEPGRHIDEYPHQLSGGMRQRVMIAAALAGEPELLIADEPTTALDVTLQAQIVSLLRRLQQENGMALWLITHDFGVVAEIADRIAVMRSGQIVETRETDFFDDPHHPYSRELLAAMPHLASCLHRKCPTTQTPTGPGHPPLLEVSDFSVFYPIKKGILQRTVNHVRAVDGVSFTLGAGETLALVGESGCGKTTLGKGILNLIAPSGGMAYLNGVSLGSRLAADQRQRCSDLQIVFQDPFSSMNPRLLVENIVAEGLRLQKPELTQNERRERVEQLLVSVGLPANARLRYPHEFSGGQRQRICIARALAVEPRILICDEPTSALDVSVQAQILSLLRALQERSGLSYLFITHDLAVVSELADRVAVMQSGKIVEIGPVREILFNPSHPYTRRLLASLPRLYHTGTSWCAAETATQGAHRPPLNEA